MKTLNTSKWIALAALVLLAGCGQKAEQSAGTASDSLLAASPVEPAQGELTPQTDFQQAEVTENPATTPKPAAKPKPKPAAPPAAPKPVGVTVPSGTSINIVVAAQISSETAQVGDTFEGEVKEAVVIGTAAPIPAGSKATVVVVGAKPAEKGSRAMLLLAVRSVTVEGKTHTINATADSMIAGSTRKRNVGAVAGSAAAGALIGSAVGGGKGALIGGLAGGAAGAGVVATTKGFPVIVKEGTEVTFKTNGSQTLPL